MKYVLILGDGMADEPIKELDGKTPIEEAKTPVIDALAKTAEVGSVNTIPEGMSPGSDVANLSVAGYEPSIYYTGRSPLEALSIGVDMKETDVSLRCNIVTLSEEDAISYKERTIVDHSSGEITTEEADVLIKDLKKELEREGYQFYLGVSYRHLLVWDKGEVIDLVAPHDILTKRIGDYLPKDEIFYEMMEKSYEILKDHPINKKRREKGLNPANSVWFWGAGKKPMLTSFEEKTGKKAAMISAVDLLKGIAVGAGMHSIDVEGATGGLHTNYEGKATAAVKVILEEGYDFVYVHVEAPDEMGHQGNLKHKIQAIEYLDERIIKPIKESLDASGEDYRMLILPDHPTPIALRTHTANPVPYLLYDSTKALGNNEEYSEKVGMNSRAKIEKGHTLIEYLFEE